MDLGGNGWGDLGVTVTTREDTHPIKRAARGTAMLITFQRTQSCNPNRVDKQSNKRTNTNTNPPAHVYNTAAVSV